jgi:Tfp pilus assembly protein PilN
MIQINLLPGPKKKKKGASGPGFQMPDFKALLAKVKDPLLLGVVGAWIVIGAGVGLTYVARLRSVAAATAQREAVEKEKKKYDAMITEKRKADSLRVKLEAEIVAIKSIDADRFIWPHVLEEITKALPDYTWLVNIEYIKNANDLADTSYHGPPPIRMQIEGRTSDIEAYTRFVRQLSNSPWMSGIVVGATQTVVEQDRPVTAFTITAMFHDAGPAYKRTVPVRETVR